MKGKNITVEMAADIVLAAPTPEIKRRMFIFFEEYLWPTPNVLIIARFAKLCGYKVVHEDFEAADAEEAEECWNDDDLPY